MKLSDINNNVSWITLLDPKLYFLIFKLYFHKYYFIITPFLNISIDLRMSSWVDITEEFNHHCSELEVGQLIHDSRFDYMSSWTVFFGLVEIFSRN